MSTNIKLVIYSIIISYMKFNSQWEVAIKQLLGKHIVLTIFNKLAVYIINKVNTVDVCSIVDRLLQ